MPGDVCIWFPSSSDEKIATKFNCEGDPWGNNDKEGISSIGVEDSDKIIRKGTLHVKLFKERIICTMHQKLSTILDRLEVKKKKI